MRAAAVFLAGVLVGAGGMFAWATPGRYVLHGTPMVKLDTWTGQVWMPEEPDAPEPFPSGASNPPIYWDPVLQQKP